MLAAIRLVVSLVLVGCQFPVDVGGSTRDCLNPCRTRRNLHAHAYLALCRSVGHRASGIPRQPWHRAVTGRSSGMSETTRVACLPGVTVTATSPVLIGARTVVTDAQGYFRLLNLPPGVVHARRSNSRGSPHYRQEGIVDAGRRDLHAEHPAEVEHGAGDRDRRRAIRRCSRSARPRTRSTSPANSSARFRSRRGRATPTSWR